MDHLISQFLNPGIRELHAYEPGRPIEMVQKKYGLTHIIKLASNENPLGPSKVALCAVEKALSTIALYPESSGIALREKLGRMLNVDPAAIVLGNGSNDVIELLFRLVVNSGVSVSISQYAFAVYEIVTQALGGRIVEVPAKNFGHDLTGLLSSITPSTRIVVIANPNNPTGTYVSYELLKSFIEHVPKHVLILIDEAYHEYIEVPDYASVIPLIAQHENLVVTRTFSKAYGLAGLRLGYLIAHPEIARLIHQIRQPFHVNRLAMVAGEAALEDITHLEHAKRLNRQGLQFFSEYFAQIGLNIIPSVANFITVHVKNNCQAIFEKMMAKGVIVRPLSSYGLPQHLRISTGLESENERCIEVLNSVLQEQRLAS